MQVRAEASEKGGEPLAAIIDAPKPVDASLADSIEKVELDYEGQADSGKPDLTVIAKDAKDVLNLLSQVAAKLKITP